MARLALISDIHANLEAFEAVLAQVHAEAPDQVICLGDVVGYGPDPAACVEIVYETCDVALLGNHDEAALQEQLPTAFNPAALASLEYTRRMITPVHKSTIRNWETRRLIEGVALTHGSFG
ncbi:MAG: metallophosphoesterase family protein, partial [Planctomycetota bacterium]|nr:metallophosphoesterase family protein [Planctomycetota bacterium]